MSLEDISQGPLSAFLTEQDIAIRDEEVAEIMPSDVSGSQRING